MTGTILVVSNQAGAPGPVQYMSLFLSCENYGRTAPMFRSGQGRVPI